MTGEGVPKPPPATAPADDSPETTIGEKTETVFPEPDPVAIGPL